jgi:hypothetical protein
MEPETVSQAIVGQVLSGEGKQIFLPGRFALLPLLRAMPQWVRHGSRRKIANTLSVPEGWERVMSEGNECGRGVFVFHRRI